MKEHLHEFTRSGELVRTVGCPPECAWYVATSQDGNPTAPAEIDEVATDGPPFDGCAEHGVYPCHTCRRIKEVERRAD